MFFARSTYFHVLCHVLFRTIDKISIVVEASRSWRRSKNTLADWILVQQGEDSRTNSHEICTRWGFVLPFPSGTLTIYREYGVVVMVSSVCRVLGPPLVSPKSCSIMYELIKKMKESLKEECSIVASLFQATQKVSSSAVSSVTITVGLCLVVRKTFFSWKSSCWCTTGEEKLSPSR